MTVTSPNDPDAPVPTEAPPSTVTEPSTTVRASGVSKVATILTSHLFFYLLVWIGIGAVMLTINLVSKAVADDVTAAGWPNQTTVFQYGMLAGGIVVVTGYVPVIVTQGVTRRTATSASLVAVALLAAGGTLATLAAQGIEQLVFAVNDWPFVLDQDLADNMHIYDRPDQYGLMFVEVLVAYTSHVVAGLLIGGGFYRYGWVWGIPALLAGTALAVVTEFLVRSGWVGVQLGNGLGLDPPPVAVGIAGAAGLIVIGAWGVRRIVGGLPLDTQHASWWR